MRTKKINKRGGKNIFNTIFGRTKKVSNSLNNIKQCQLNYILTDGYINQHFVDLIEPIFETMYADVFKIESINLNDKLLREFINNLDTNLNTFSLSGDTSTLNKNLTTLITILHHLCKESKIAETVNNSTDIATIPCELSVLDRYILKIITMIYFKFYIKINHRPEFQFGGDIQKTDRFIPTKKNNITRATANKNINNTEFIVTRLLTKINTLLLRGVELEKFKKFLDNTIDIDLERDKDIVEYALENTIISNSVSSDKWGKAGYEIDSLNQKMHDRINRKLFLPFTKQNYPFIVTNPYWRTMELNTMYSVFSGDSITSYSPLTSKTKKISKIPKNNNSNNFTRIQDGTIVPTIRGDLLVDEEKVTEHKEEKAALRQVERMKTLEQKTKGRLIKEEEVRNDTFRTGIQYSSVEISKQLYEELMSSFKNIQKTLNPINPFIIKNGEGIFMNYKYINTFYKNIIKKIQGLFNEYDLLLENYIPQYLTQADFSYFFGSTNQSLNLLRGNLNNNTLTPNVPVYDYDINLIISYYKKNPKAQSLEDIMSVDELNMQQFIKETWPNDLDLTAFIKFAVLKNLLNNFNKTDYRELKQIISYIKTNTKLVIKELNIVEKQLIKELNIKLSNIIKESNEKLNSLKQRLQELESIYNKPYNQPFNAPIQIIPEIEEIKKQIETEEEIYSMLDTNKENYLFDKVKLKKYFYNPMDMQSQSIDIEVSPRNFDDAIIPSNIRNYLQHKTEILNSIVDILLNNKSGNTDSVYETYKVATLKGGTRTRKVGFSNVKQDLIPKTNKENSNIYMFDDINTTQCLNLLNYFYCGKIMCDPSVYEHIKRWKVFDSKLSSYSLERKHQVMDYLFAENSLNAINTKERNITMYKVNNNRKAQITFGLFTINNEIKLCVFSNLYNNVTKTISGGGIFDRITGFFTRKSKKVKKNNVQVDQSFREGPNCRKLIIYKTDTIENNYCPVSVENIYNFDIDDIVIKKNKMLIRATEKIEIYGNKDSFNNLINALF